uniref:G_PROTEIN_RECEP_F1_2 domain-containing protein n=1 Tax=Meloidogyne hapla TaxID=6305 RepID=A0A1I8BD54_MELHA
MPSSNITNPNCLDIENLLLNPLFGFITWFQIIILFILFLFSALLFRQCRKSKIPLHSNLTILTYTYTDNCNLLTPVWLAVVLIAPNYFYFIANTCIHFLIMFERVRATIFVKNYEREGIKFAVGGIVVVWILSITYTIYIICSALADKETFGQPMGIVILTSKYNATIILYSFYIAIYISGVITLCDFFVYRANKKIIRE